MASRKDLKKQKEKTSQALIQAALQLCAEEGYASLSLRSVARKAGIAPTSFYRHFREIDEMGVEMVAQAKMVLEDFLAQAQKKMTFPAIQKNDDPAKSVECITRPFAETFIRVMGKNPQLVHLFFQEKTGSAEDLRDAIFEATETLTEILAENLDQLCKASKNDLGDVSLIAETMLTIVSACGMEMIVRPDNKPKMITTRAILKLNLLLLGALTDESTKQGTKQTGDGHE